MSAVLSVLKWMVGWIPEAARVPLWRFGFMSAFILHVAWTGGLIPMVPGVAWAGDIARAQKAADDNKVAITQLAKTVQCANYDQEISSLRKEDRDIDTQLFQARQSGNADLEQYLMGRKTDVNQKLDDEIKRRDVNNCAVEND